MKKNKLKYAVTFLVIVISLNMTTSWTFAEQIETEQVIAPNYVDYTLLDIPTYKQERDRWCWAATSQMVISHLGGNKTQSQIVRYVKGKIINEGAKDKEVISGLNWAGLSATRTNGIITFGKIVSQISANQPILAHINWKNESDLGHMVVIRGFYNYTETGQRDVYYKDPAQNRTTNRVMSYAEFDENWEFFWYTTIHSIYVM